MCVGSLCRCLRTDKDDVDPTFIQWLQLQSWHSRQCLCPRALHIKVDACCGPHPPVSVHFQPHSDTLLTIAHKAGLWYPGGPDSCIILLSLDHLVFLFPLITNSLYPMAPSMPRSEHTRPTLPSIHTLCLPDIHMLGRHNFINPHDLHDCNDLPVSLFSVLALVAHAEYSDADSRAQRRAQIMDAFAADICIIIGLFIHRSVPPCDAPRLCPSRQILSPQFQPRPHDVRQGKRGHRRAPTLRP